MPVCPKCKSPRIVDARVNSSDPISVRCQECGTYAEYVPQTVIDAKLKMKGSGCSELCTAGCGRNARRRKGDSGICGRCNNLLQRWLVRGQAAGPPVKLEALLPGELRTRVLKELEKRSRRAA